MQTILDIPISVTVIDTVADMALVGVDRLSAQKIANTYLCNTFGLHFCVNDGVRTPAVWRFLIQYQAVNGARPVVIGRLDVDLLTGTVMPLTPHEILTIQDRFALLLADSAGALPVDQDGYVLPYLAKRNVKGYLGMYISIFARPAGEPEWVTGDPPCWRVAIVLARPTSTTHFPLGTIQVNAQTGEVIPLTENQLQAMQRHLHYAAVRPSSPATTLHHGLFPFQSSPIVLYAIGHLAGHCLAADAERQRAG